MARGRMLSKSISTNKRLGLAGPDPALAWFLSLPHADVQGCLPGSLQELEMICFPVAISFFGWTRERVENLLNLLVLHGFWRLVVDDLGQKAIYIERFGDHQTLRLDQDKQTNFIFSNGVENAAALSPQEWREISEIPPNFRGINSAKTPRKFREDSAETPRSRGKPSAQVKSSEVEEEGKGKSSARARNPLQEISPARRQETAMIEDDVIRDFQAAHPQGEKCIIRRWDKDAIPPAAHALAQLQDRTGFFKRALAALPAERQTLEAAIGCLNNPEIVACRSKKRSAWEYCEDQERNGRAI